MKLSRSPLFQSFSEFFMAVMMAVSFEAVCAPAWVERREMTRKVSRERLAIWLAILFGGLLVPLI